MKSDSNNKLARRPRDGIDPLFGDRQGLEAELSSWYICVSEPGVRG